MESISLVRQTNAVDGSLLSEWRYWNLLEWCKISLLLLLVLMSIGTVCTIADGIKQKKFEFTQRNIVVLAEHRATQAESERDAVRIMLTARDTENRVLATDNKVLIKTNLVYETAFGIYRLSDGNVKFAKSKRLSRSQFAKLLRKERVLIAQVKNAWPTNPESRISGTTSICEMQAIEVVSKIAYGGKTVLDGAKRLAEQMVPTAHAEETIQKAEALKVEPQPIVEMATPIAKTKPVIVEQKLAINTARNSSPVLVAKLSKNKAETLKEVKERARRALGMNEKDAELQKLLNGSLKKAETLVMQQAVRPETKPDEQAAPLIQPESIPRPTEPVATELQQKTMVHELTRADEEIMKLKPEDTQGTTISPVNEIIPDLQKNKEQVVEPGSPLKRFISFIGRSNRN